MRIHRDLYAWIVLAASLAGAGWFYMYRVWSLVEYIEPTGRHFRPSERVRVQPWWSVYAAVALLLIGAATAVWLLPELKRKRLVKRFGSLFPSPS